MTPPPLPTREELAEIIIPKDAAAATSWRWEDDTAQFLVVEIPSRKLTLVWPMDSEPVLTALLEPYVARALRGESAARAEVGARVADVEAGRQG